ncbi:hypothetical protein BDR05DRAFT_968346 [Suillus weaverae]|nr:hypothetical protein BDR05DRAFT_968346 [Suillus weaverae]
MTLDDERIQYDKAWRLELMPPISRTTMNVRKWNYSTFPMTWVAIILSPLVQNVFFFRFVLLNQGGLTCADDLGCLSLLAPRKQTDGDNATPDPAGTEGRTG